MFIKNENPAKHRQREREKQDAQGITDLQILVVQILEQNALLQAQNEILQADITAMKEAAGNGEEENNG